MKKLMSILFVLCAIMLAVCASAEAPVMDRAGNAIAVPEKVDLPCAEHVRDSGCAG